jgi:hypothetical protein
MNPIWTVSFHCALTKPFNIKQIFNIIFQRSSHILQMFGYLGVIFCTCLLCHPSQVQEP